MKKIYVLILTLILQGFINFAHASIITQTKNIIGPVNGIIDGQFTKIESVNGLYLFNFALQNEQILYAVSASRFLYKSLDGGLHWKQLPNSPEDIMTFQLVNTKGKHEIYVATSGSLQVSNDDGKTWSTIFINPDNQFIDNIAINEKGILYVVSVDNYTSNNATVNASNDNGKSWSKIGKTLTYSSGDFIDHTVITANNEGPVLYFHGGLYVLSNGSDWYLTQPISTVISMASDTNYNYLVTYDSNFYRFNSISGQLDSILNAPWASFSVVSTLNFSSIYFMTVDLNRNPYGFETFYKCSLNQ